MGAKSKFRRPLSYSSSGRTVLVAASVIGGLLLAACLLSFLLTWGRVQSGLGKEAITPTSRLINSASADFTTLPIETLVSDEQTSIAQLNDSKVKLSSQADWFS